MQSKKERLEHINIELAHSHYLDGWVIEGLKKEKKELEKCLDSVENQKQS